MNIFLQRLLTFDNISYRKNGHVHVSSRNVKKSCCLNFLSTINLDV